MRFLARLLIFCFVCVFADALLAEGSGVLRMRFLDSETGYAVQPQVVLSGYQNGGALGVRVSTNGTARLELPVGNYTVTITSESHATMSTAVAINDATPPLQFTLDPLVKPEDLQRDYIVSSLRPDATLFVGYVVGHESGQPLENVRVYSQPSGVQTFTDSRGYFQISVPLQSDEEYLNTPAILAYAKDGFQTEEHHNLELVSNGDWIFRIRLDSGSGTNVVDEMGRRIAPEQSSTQVASISAKDPIVANATSPTNATIRLPTNIRVLLTNGTVDYVSMETYTARSLSQEWFSSWGNYSGGINSLKAGAVAVRAYAAWYVNNASSSSTYDICSTTSCQVYRQSSSSNGDTAAAQTSGYVIVDSSNRISRSEYSAENNSLGFSCGDGFTQPTGGCIADPVCAGETRFGHGRGMCQWGTAKWATGLKIAGNGGGYPANANSGATNGYPKQDWIWIVNHYYPNLKLVQAKPLVIGDDVKVVGSSSQTSYMCADGGISAGTGCTVSNFVRAVGTVGVVTNGPVRVTSDGKGFTWWKVVWSDNKVGWIPENWLERVIPVPSAPTNLRAAAVSTNRVNLTWSTNNVSAIGFKIERSVNGTGNWLQIDDISSVTNYADTTVLPASTNYYRIRAYNLGGNSPYSNTTNAVVPDVGPTLAAISNQTVSEGATLAFTSVATAPDYLTAITDFESYADGAAVMFRAPGQSGSTSTHIDATVANSSAVVSAFPAYTGADSRVLKSSWSFKTGTTNPWLRLTTGGTANRPNPVIDFTKKLRFDIYTDKSLRIALGARETTNAVGTPIGSDGGTLGAIEFVGVASGGTQPNPSRTIAASAWTTVTFNIPAEPVANFASGNGVLSTASGLGVLEHLALVPNGGLGAYNVYFDNFAVARPKNLTFSLDAGAPAGAAIHPVSGVFSWTPTEAQGPGTYTITVRVTDDQSPPQSATRTFQVTVTETNAAPVLTSIPDQVVHAGNSLVLTNTATDPDIPANSLSFSLDPGAPVGAAINAASGVFTWTPGDSFAGSSSTITVRVSDNGSPTRSDAKSFAVSVLPKPVFHPVTRTGGNVNLSWSAIPGRKYQIQYKTSLNDAVWTNLAVVTATGATASRSEPVLGQERYFRIIALD